MEILGQKTHCFKFPNTCTNIYANKTNLEDLRLWLRHTNTCYYVSTFMPNFRQEDIRMQLRQTITRHLRLCPKFESSSYFQLFNFLNQQVKRLNKTKITSLIFEFSCSGQLVLFQFIKQLSINALKLSHLCFFTLPVAVTGINYINHRT